MATEPKSWDTILSDEPTIDDLPFSEGDPADGEAGDGASGGGSEVSGAAEAGETPVVAAPATEAPAAPDLSKPGGVTPPAVAEAGAPGSEDPDAVPDDLQGLKSAVRAERKLRREKAKGEKEANLRISRLEGQLSELQTQRTTPATAPAADSAAEMDVFLGEPTDWVDRRIAAAEERVQSRILQERAISSESRMRMAHDDYEEAAAAFKEAAGRENWRWQPVMQDLSPADVVYREGKRILEENSLDADGLGGDPRSEIAALHQRLAVLEGGGAPAPTQFAPAAPPQPSHHTIPKPSQAGTRGSGVGRPPSWAGPRPLEDMFKPQG